ncbi:MAG: T9SS type A sorting domain-containing protein [Bacteroidota bacterium]
MKLLHLLGIGLLLSVTPLSSQDLRSANLRVEQLSHKTVRLSIDVYARLHANTPVLRICWGDGNCEEWISTPDEIWPTIDLRRYRWDGFHGYGFEGEVDITVETCCYTQDILNLPLDEPQPLQIQTSFQVVADADEALNTTPTISPHFITCNTNSCDYLPQIEDAEKDSLVWEFCRPPIEAYRPLNEIVADLNDLQFNPQTGRLTWSQPIDQGWFSHVVCLREYRDQRLLSKTLWQLLLHVEENLTSSSSRPSPNDSWSVFPNPTPTTLHWSTPPQSASTVQVYDHQGRVVLQEPMGQNLDVSDLPAGLYYLRLIGSAVDQNTYRSFVKY